MKMDARTRKDMIFAAALKIVRMRGISALNYESVAAACEIQTSAATVRRYAGRVRDMQIETARRARLAGDAVYKPFLNQAAELGLTQ